MPAIQHQNSHYLLPLNSMIFESKSSTNLPSTIQHNIYTKSTTTIAHIPVEELDNDITALPPAPVNPIRRQPKMQDLAASSLTSQPSAEHLEDIRDRPLKHPRSLSNWEESDKKKASVWQRLVEALKRPFRKEKEPVVESKGPVISGPTEFQHLQTGIACLPPQTVPENDDAEVDNSEDWETVHPSDSFHG